MTTLSLTNQIGGLSDLPGKNVGVFAGSTAESFAQSAGLKVQSFPDIEAAASALTNGRVGAIVADAPVLEHYQHSHLDMAVDVVGPIFEPEKYGFGLNSHSMLAGPLTIELLGAKEGGLIEDLRKKYFGNE